MAREAALVVVASPEDSRLLGKRYALRRELSIGSDPRCEISVDSPSLIAHHATVKRFGSAAWEVEAAHPAAVVHVNDRPAAFAVLADGDEISAGPLRLRLLAAGNLEQSYHAIIYQLTIIDGETGAFNRRFLIEGIEREMIRARRHGRPLALAVFRVAGWTSGAGTLAIRKVVAHFRDLFDKDSVIARVVSDGLAVLLPESSLSAAASLVEQARAALTSADLSAAVRLVSLEPCDDSAEALLTRALDAAPPSRSTEPR